MEVRIRGYFAALQLKKTPTLYDHLVLGLRPKDVIATFNWDPFLADALVRNARYATLPCALFLHGNVRVGSCEQDRVVGIAGDLCKKCGLAYQPTKLLYPVAQKNYPSDPFIRRQWEILRKALGNAYMLTVFGYGAPQSDIEAIQLMRTAWGEPGKRSLEEVELIDVKSEDELREVWKPFIHTHHYRRYVSFYESWIARHPRRTCEATWEQFMEIRFLQDNPIPATADFPTLLKWFGRLIEAENKQRR